MRKSVIKNGYIYAYAPDHPFSDNRGYYPEHILVMEKKIGRYISDDEVVHHLDLNRANNRISNLLLLSYGQHSALHRWLEQGAPIADVKHGLKKSIRAFASGELIYSEPNLCRHCGNSVHNDGVYCKHSCATSDRRTEVSVKRMRKLMDKYSWVEIGRRLGVSDNGARKIARRLGLL